MRKVVYLAVLAATLLPALAASAETPAEKHVAQQIGSHLKQSGQLQNYKVGVKFHDGVALLGGTVANAEQRDTAVRLAQQCQASSTSSASSTARTIATRVTSNSRQSRAPNGDHQKLASQLESDLIRRASKRGLECVASFRASGQPHQAAPMAAPSAAFNRILHRCQQTKRSATCTSSPQARRSNMPVPYQRMPGMMPPRQAAGPTERCSTSQLQLQRWRHGPWSWHGDGWWLVATALRASSRAVGRGGAYGQSANARLRLAELRFVPELRCLELSATVFANGLAVHRSVLSVSASAAGMAESVARMGRRLVVPRLQLAQLEPLSLSGKLAGDLESPE